MSVAVIYDDDQALAPLEGRARDKPWWEHLPLLVADVKAGPVAFQDPGTIYAYAEYAAAHGLEVDIDYADAGHDVRVGLRRVRPFNIAYASHAIAVKQTVEIAGQTREDVTVVVPIDRVYGFALHMPGSP